MERMSRDISRIVLVTVLAIFISVVSVAYCQTVNVTRGTPTAVSIKPVAYAYWIQPKIPGPGTCPAVLRVVVFVPNVEGVKFYLKNVRVTLGLPDYVEWFGQEEQICHIQYMGPGTNATCIFYLKIEPGAPSGLEKFKIIIYYNIYYISTHGVFGEQTSVTYEENLPIIGTLGIEVVGAYLGGKNYEIVGPGMKNIPLTIIVMNTGTNTLYNVRLRLRLTYPIYATRNGTIVKYLNTSLPALPPGRPVTLTYLVNIYDNVTGGCYKEELYVKYGIGTSWSLKTSFRLCIPEVRFSGVTAFWGTPSRVMAVGPGYSRVPLTVIFVPDTAINNLTVCIGLRPPLEGHGLLCKNIGTVVSGREIPVTFIVSVLPNVTGGKYPLDIYFLYGSIEEKHVAKIVIYEPKVRVVSAIPTPPVVLPGMYGAILNVTILNTGYVIAKNVTVRLILPRNFTVYTPNVTSVTLPAVPPGRVMPLVFMFNVPNNVTPGTYRFTVQVKYLDTVRDYVTYVKVLPEPRFEIEKIEEIGFYPGSSKAILIIYLRYVDGPELEGVKAILSIPKVFTFHIPQNNPLAAMTANQIIIGNLKPGQTVELTYLLEVDSSAPIGKYRATLMLLYTPKPLIITAVGKVPTLAKSIPVTLTVRETVVTIMYKHIPEIICVIFIIIAIIAIAVARARRKKR
ncbi:MAG: hypothetical protein GXO23_04515 [Crenarchaeota archaeon]|nr:hypothetical protein [Thermoproteota archaeon]